MHQSHELLNLLIVGFILVQVFMQLTALMRTYLTNFMVRNLDFSMMSQFFNMRYPCPISFSPSAAPATSSRGFGKIRPSASF